MIKQFNIMIAGLLQLFYALVPNLIASLVFRLLEKSLNVDLPASWLTWFLIVIISMIMFSYSIPLMDREFFERIQRIVSPPTSSRPVSNTTTGRGGGNFWRYTHNHHFIFSQGTLYSLFLLLRDLCDNPNRLSSFSPDNLLGILIALVPLFEGVVISGALSGYVDWFYDAINLLVANRNHRISETMIAGILVSHYHVPSPIPSEFIRQKMAEYVNNRAYRDSTARGFSIVLDCGARPEERWQFVVTPLG